MNADTNPGWSTLDEDENLVVALKPAGLSTITERDPSVPSLHRELEAARGERLWIVHRLDKDTSGIVLFARNAGAHRTLSLSFENRKVEKVYRAVVHGRPDGDQGAIEAPLRICGSGRTAVDREKGKASETLWKIVREVGPWTEVLLRPLTGRRHQLRVHLYAIGCPVVGDPLYGTPEQRADDGRMLLHSEQLGLEFPAGQSRAWECPVPEDFAARIAVPPARA